MTTSVTAPPWLVYAESQVGYKEGPNNANKFSHDLGYPGEAWCDDFVADSCKQSGHALPSMSPGCTTGARAVIESMNWAKANGLFIPSWEGQPGDQLVYGWDGPGSSAADMHTGFGVKFGARGTTGKGCEGNRSDQVEYTTFVVGESVLLGVIDLNRLLLGKPKITIAPAKPSKVKVIPKAQPKHALHPTNTGPTKAQQAKIDAARKVAKSLKGKTLAPGGGVRKSWRKARDLINRKLAKGSK